MFKEIVEKCFVARLQHRRAPNHNTIIKRVRSEFCESVCPIDESPTYSAYMSSKAALARLSEVMAYDARPHGVMVFALRPGSVQTALVDSMLDDMGVTADELPEDIWTSPETAAEIVAMVASGAVDALAGRHIDAGVGDWRALPERIGKIMADDLFVLRLRR